MAFKPRRSEGGKPSPRQGSRDGSGSGDRDFRPSRSQDSRSSSSDKPQRREDAPRRSDGGDSSYGVIAHARMKADLVSTDQNLA
jgi:23S rRNA (guanosine2251-2'-O)-methyltransferase